MLTELLQRFAPAFAAGPTAWPLVSEIDHALSTCATAQNAVETLRSLQPRQYEKLRRVYSPAVAMALTLKILNIFLARYHQRARATQVISRPAGLVIDPSNMCQLACPGCVHSNRSESLGLFLWPKGTLLEDRFTALLKQYGPYAVGVYFCNYGEPLLNLNTPKLIRRSKTYLMWTALSTSLSVKRFDAEDYVQSGLDFMVLSIDGATQKVYEQFRRHGDLELVFNNVRDLVAARRRLRKRTPVLSWNFLAFEHNAHEIGAAGKKARELGVDQFRVVNPFDVTWDDPAIRPAPVRGRVRRLNWSAAQNPPENFNPFPEDLDAAAIGHAFNDPWPGRAAVEGNASQGHTCHWLYKSLSMDAAGRIMPCCGSPRPDADLVFAQFDGAGEDVFNSPKYREARAHFAGANTTSTYCAQCEWDQSDVTIGQAEIRRYFRAAGPTFFDRRSLRILSGW